MAGARGAGWRARLPGRTVPPAVWLLTVLHLLVCACWALLLPTYAGPREATQVDLALRTVEAPLETTWAERPLSHDVVASLSQLDFSGDPQQRLLAGGATLRKDRPSFTELAASAAPPTGQAIVAAGPPAHRLLAAGWLAATPGFQSWAFDQVVLHLRLLSVLLLAPLPLLLHAIAVRLSPHPWVAVAAAASALGVPTLGVLGGTVGADALAIVATGVATLGALDLARGRFDLRTGTMAGAGMAVAVLTSGATLMLLPWLACAVGIGLWRRARPGPCSPEPNPQRTPAWTAPAIAAIGALGGAAWWLAARGAGSDVPLVVGRAPDAPAWLPAARGLSPGPLDRSTLLGGGADEFLAVLADVTTSTFGAFGFARAPFPLPWAVAGALLIVVGAVIALAPHREVRARVDAALLVAPFVLLLGLVVAAALRAEDPAALADGRHLLPGAAGLLAVSAAGFGSALGPLQRRRLPLVVLGLAVTAQAFAVWVAGEISWGPGTGGVQEALDAWRAWTPVSPVAGVVTAGLTVATAGASMALLLRGARSAPSEHELRADRRVHDEPEGQDQPCRRRVRLVLVINAAVILAVIGGLRLADRAGIPGHELVRDTIAVVDGQVHAGLLSNLGIIVWTLGAGCCLLAAAALRAHPPMRRHARLLAGVGGLTAMLATDDLIVFHEGAGIGPQWLGIPAELIMGVYALTAIGLVVAYRDLLVTLPGRIIILVALGFLAVSVVVDLVDPLLTYVVEEDVAKLIGIVNWALGWGIAATTLVRQAMTAPPEGATAR